MSGLAAILRTDGAPVPKRELDSMLSELEHRGPSEDRQGERPLALGCRWDPEPFDVARPAAGIVRRDGLWIAADSRIDNRDELMEALPEGETERSDAELILDAYRRWGIGVAASLEGDFAFVLWDSHKRTLVCARDAIGVRPLYYGERAGELRVASEMYCIVADGRIDKSPDETQLALYLLGHYSEHRTTLYRRVKPVPAAHTLIVDADGSHRLRRDWEPNPWMEIRYRSDSEYGEHFHEIFARAVRRRVPTGRPCSVQLSGGLDSSSVISEAARQAGQAGRAPPLAIRMVFPGLDADESEYSDSVAERWDLEMVSVDPRDHAELCAPEVSRMLPDLLFHSAGIHLEPTFVAARERGIRTVLTGMGADDMMRPTGVDTEHHLSQMDLRAALRSAGVSAHPRMLAPWLDLLKAAPRSFAPAKLLALRQSLTRPRVAGLELIRQGRRSEVVEAFQDLRRARGALRAPTRLGSTNLALFSGPSVLVPFMSRLDRMSARRGVDYAHPFLDRAVCEYVLALPLEQRIRGTLCKPVLRSAMRGILPELVRTRTTQAYLTSYLHATLERQRASLQQMFECSLLWNLQIADGDVARGLLKQPVHRLSNSDLWLLMNMVSLELWLRRIGG